MSYTVSIIKKEMKKTLINPQKKLRSYGPAKKFGLHQVLLQRLGFVRSTGLLMAQYTVHIKRVSGNGPGLTWLE